jgi:glucose-6-phosphate 1-dehydrogenase
MAKSQSDALVIFGVTGDLAHKMIFPALYAMVKRGALKVPVIGVAFPKWSMERLHKRVTDSIERAGGVDNKRALQHLLSLLKYVSGDYKDSNTFAAIKEALGNARCPAHYLAIPPSLFETVIKGLGAAKLAEHARVIVEKSPSDATWPLHGSSTRLRIQSFLRTQSSASITSLEKKRS